MKNKIVDFETIVSMLKDNMTILVGGFASVGVPEQLIDAVIASKAKNLTIISNDSSHPGFGLSKIINTDQVSKLVASHIGMNPQTSEKMNQGKLEVVLVPQGTLVERIRAGGAGLGGVLTQTGLGTEVEICKKKMTIDEKEYLLETPIRADLALIRGSIVDKNGSIFYKGTTQNFNPIMATAADVVIVEAEKIVEVGDIQAENIRTPGIFIDYIIGGTNHE